MRSRVLRDKIDGRMAVKIANSYFLSAANYFPAHSTEEFVRNFLENIGDTALYASNLLFATELHLRLIIENPQNPPKHHNLWKIWNRVSRQNRTSVEELYSAREHDSSQYITIMVGADHLERESVENEVHEAIIRAKSRGAGIQETLKLAADTYNQWRYLYQSISMTKKRRIITLPYGGLLHICSLLQENYRNQFDGRS